MDCRVNGSVKMNKPNVIIIMTDDQGYGDLSCMGATDFRTPHIDALADDGIRFTSMYSASSVCSPSRVLCSQADTREMQV